MILFKEIISTNQNDEALLTVELISDTEIIDSITSPPLTLKKVHFENEVHKKEVIF